MKKILGLDLGTTSIGWAIVNESQIPEERSSIIDAGVRHIPLTVDEQSNFEQGGKGQTICALRTLKRSMRRNLQRYKLRRKALTEILSRVGWITPSTVLPEHAPQSTFQILRLRALAAQEKISLEDFARVLLKINKKRGYKSSRKMKSAEDGNAIDSFDTAKMLHEEGITPGQLSLSLLNSGKTTFPEFYPSDLQNEFDRIWNTQCEFYPTELTEDKKKSLIGKNGNATWAILREIFGLEGIRPSEKGVQKLHLTLGWREKALAEKLDPEHLAIVLQEINSSINATGSYLGAISDRSKMLMIHGKTVGQYQFEKLSENPHYSLKNKVFYRQDYLAEFEQIWATQAQYYPEMTTELKNEIRDVVIFYQRRLRSQKHTIGLCELESRKITCEIDGQKKEKQVGLRGCPKSSPLFQEFKIWQNLNNLFLTDKRTYEKIELTLPEKEQLFELLSAKPKLTESKILKCLGKSEKAYELNYEELPGNETFVQIASALKKIFSLLEKPLPQDEKIFEEAIILANERGWDSSIFKFDSSLEKKDFEKQSAYRFWHLLYSYEGDDSKSGNKTLIESLKRQFRLDDSVAAIFADIQFGGDYGSLSAKAIRKILPHMRKGLGYAQACAEAGYKHSKHSLTNEELAQKQFKDRIELLPKNSLRNPVVEKILNQMAHVVNAVIEQYGKPDEIRIELARELKKNAKERKEQTDAIRKNERENAEICKILEKPPFNLSHPSKTDITRYKLYRELESRGFKTLYSNTYIPAEELLSGRFEIEHILPKAKIFDDSFANKTLETRDCNQRKGEKTAFDFISEEQKEDYRKSVNDLFEGKKISKRKRDNLLMRTDEIPEGFIERDLRDTQYIAKKSREILEELVPIVTSTTGSITDRLRRDWQLVNVIQELNWEKYEACGQIEQFERKDRITGKPFTVEQIKDWSKRDDNRHHAMDAITIAFTRPCYIQYLNHLNAKHVEIEKQWLYADKSQGSENKTKRFLPPIPLDEFRNEVKTILQRILISNKAKNKVVTQNQNKIPTSNGTKTQRCLTPRGQLHNETVYAARKKPVIKIEKVNHLFSVEKANTVTNAQIREALLRRLAEFENNPKKAFGEKNALSKNPIFLDKMHTQCVPEKVKTLSFEQIFTIRKPISPDLKLEKVADLGIRKILEDRLREFGGDAQRAFSEESLKNNPIWQNKEKGIAIKRVQIDTGSNAVPLHAKRDVYGNPILKDGSPVPSDFVSPENNHHTAIYKSRDGKYHEVVVSFLEATSRAIRKLPIIDKEYKRDEGWTFCFSMKKNEYFLIPNPQSGFFPHQLSREELMNPENYARLSPHLFRLQKMSIRNYMFRHHLESSVKEIKELKGVTYINYRSLDFAKNILKVRINHLGKIVDAGEY